MRNAIGSSLLLNIVLVFVGIISAFLVGTIAFSKAYKVKNRIVSIIEKYDGDCFGSNTACYNEIEAELVNIGYSSNFSKSDCPDITLDSRNSTGIKSIDTIYNGTLSGGHQYCVYKYTVCDTKKSGRRFICDTNSTEQYYYKVVTFMHFDIPIIGSFLEFEVSGETKPFYSTFVNIKQ